jgi:hypothetical protein
VVIAAPGGMGGPAICGAGAARVPNCACVGYRAATSFGTTPLSWKVDGLGLEPVSHKLEVA